MSDHDNDTLPVPDALITLKARADMLGVKYHPTISLDKLRAKVNAAVEGKPEVADEDSKPVASAAAAEETPGQKRGRLRKEAMRLVRVRVACMNPMKKEWEGEILTVGNSAIGTVKKYVPFNADEGWHVPHVIYEQLRDRQCQIFVSGKSKSGVTVRQAKLIKEFAVEVLPPLTEEELAELARRQSMAGAVG